MKKKVIVVGMLFILMGMVAACGKSTSELKYLKDFEAGKYVDLGEYKGVSITLEKEEVTEEALESYINGLLQNSSVVKPVTDRTAVESGDTANIDYLGKLDGVAFEGGAADGFDLTIGSGQFIPGFEDGIIGMEVGETKDITVTFPDPYPNNSDLAGKDAIFTVTVNSIGVQEIPELTDEYVASLELEECATAQEYRDVVKEILEEQASEAFEADKQFLTIEAVEQAATFKDAPEGMVNRMNDTLLKNVTSYAQMYGMDVAQYVTNMYGGTEDTYQDVLLQQATLMAKRYIMLQAIAEKEGLVMTDEEVNAQLEQEATSYGYETVDEYKSELDIEAYKEYLVTQKVIEFLTEQAVVEAK